MGFLTTINVIKLKMAKLNRKQKYLILGAFLWCVAEFIVTMFFRSTSAAVVVGVYVDMGITFAIFITSYLLSKKRLVVHIIAGAVVSFAGYIGTQITCVALAKGFMGYLFGTVAVIVFFILDLLATVYLLITIMPMDVVADSAPAREKSPTKFISDSDVKVYANTPKTDRVETVSNIGRDISSDDKLVVRTYDGSGNLIKEETRE